MPFVTVARVEDVPPGTVTRVHAGEAEFALANIDDEFFATQGACLHLQGPLGDGKLEGAMIVCPWHGWRYDVRTGFNDFDHAIRIRTFEVRVEDGDIQVAV
jgi:nitrite reductase (NADH) small subunit